MERRFGVEFEVNGITMDRAEAALRAVGLPVCRPGYTHRVMNPWKIVTDASVNNGFEVVSPILRGEEGIAEAMVAADAMKTVGAGADRSCGLHVHIETEGMDVGDAKAVFSRYARFENEIDAFMPPSRRADQNRFCRSVKELAGSRRFRQAPDIRALSDVPTERYYKVNLRSLNIYRTLEFRQHNGIVDADRTSHWIRFLDAFVTESVRRARTGEQALPEAVPAAASGRGNLSPSQQRALEMMRREGGVTAERMAEELGVKVHSARAVVTRVRQAGYTVRAARRGAIFAYQVAGDAAAEPGRPNQAGPSERADSLYAGVDAALAKFYRNRAAVLALR